MKVPLQEDAAMMREALALADRARQSGEVPVGAVAVYQGNIIGRGWNRRETDRSPLAHAEMFALAEAASSLQAWRLSGVTLYVTLEPCAMCAGALLQARVDRLVFGARDPKAGSAGSLYNLLRDPRHNHQVQVVEGVLANECGQVLVDFFQELRQTPKATSHK